MFYADKNSQAAKVNLDLVLERAMLDGGTPTAVVYVGGEAPISVTFESSLTDYPDALKVELLSSVATVEIKNNDPGFAGSLFLTKFNDNNCGVPTKRPMMTRLHRQSGDLS